MLTSCIVTQASLTEQYDVNTVCNIFIRYRMFFRHLLSSDVAQTTASSLSEEQSRSYLACGASLPAGMSES